MKFVPMRDSLKKAYKTREMKFSLSKKESPNLNKNSLHSFTSQGEWRVIKDVPSMSEPDK